jgi:hypothetical protein
VAEHQVVVKEKRTKPNQEKSGKTHWRK